MTEPAHDIAGCVARYAARLHATIGDSHHVASPLGAWLLLALAGTASTGDDRVTLQNTLGCDVDLAARAAAALLASPHPAVASAAGVWTGPGAAVGAVFRRWQAALPAAVTRGELPGQAGLDRWAREHTGGLIESFPVKWSEALYLVLATALATRVSWLVPFERVPASELGTDSAWSRRLTWVLRAPEPQPGRPAGHSQFIAVTAEACDVAVQVASGQDGLLVCSVAADPAVPAGLVLAAAHQIGLAHAAGLPVPRRSLADLPLGPGPAWRLREQQSDQAGDMCTAVLPAWQARSGHDLAQPDLGFAAAKNALVPGGDRWQVSQAAMARFSRTGFEAAAVTAVGVRLSMARPQRRRRVADLRFGHPYAVVAVAVDAAAPAGEHSWWHGLPVFSAWVRAPEDADDDADRMVARHER